ncbi:rhodanese-like domain-containing protein [Pilimelia columellifera]|uniref:Rhodanese-like domain-containing protein n=1 Tax=Pilimelia columellifera subsp. columellifera TaxID=706583 RepID=A0ABP6AG52_9ACTN
MTIIDATTTRALIATNADTLVVDVRTPGEFDSSHIPGAINLPLPQVDEHLERIVRDAGARMILVCQGGSRAQRRQRTLADGGLADTLVLDGGMNAWTATGGPVTPGTPRWGLERQVRLVAGAIVALAVLVSVVWAPARYLAGAVGAGLVFAAVSDTCAMGHLLARLPYNRPRQAVDIDAALVRLTGARA